MKGNRSTSTPRYVRVGIPKPVGSGLDTTLNSVNGYGPIHRL